MRRIRVTAILATSLICPSVRADDFANGLDIAVEGGAIGNVERVSPIVQVLLTGRLRPAPHLALSGGIAGLPAPQLFAFAFIGRLELTPFASNVFLLFAGSRLVILQPIDCGSEAEACTREMGGVLGEVGLGLRTSRNGGYAFGLNVSCLIGPMTSYTAPVTSGLYVGGVGAIVVAF